MNKQSFRAAVHKVEFYASIANYILEFPADCDTSKKKSYITDVGKNLHYLKAKLHFQLGFPDRSSDLSLGNYHYFSKIFNFFKMNKINEVLLSFGDQYLKLNIFCLYLHLFSYFRTNETFLICFLNILLFKNLNDDGQIFYK